MAVERRFVEDGIRSARVEQFFSKELKRAGYGGMDIIRTPLGTQITIFAEKPGIVIGKGGKVVREITSTLQNDYGIESPQIEVQQVDNPSFNAQIMAERLANSLERGWYFRKAGTSILRRVMESGGLGCEVILSGKLTGARSRVQKFTQGYIKHSGEPSETIVEHGYAIAIKKLGTIGCQVKIVPPGAKLPDHFEVIEPEVKEFDPEEVSLKETVEEVPDEDVIGQEIDAEMEAAEDVPDQEDF
ncbi:small subunit ribosomal protein S3 [Methanomicrobium sp. W14]|uniref:30S ribosomal protein S3 n=1 Tax=Methanomicrobium sp. W14 TaxID=2817839 RepID=UPI001AE5C2EA|nr:30S ribosomal protein S3 [Methanomicrobium sp. W14]MBP2133165.1 small subunit ribosomal protein S3 [Methanomicrobium sp. W14]